MHKLLLLILSAIIILETYYICKKYIYIHKNENVNELLYQLLIHSQDEIKSYKVNDSLYVSIMNNAALILLNMDYDSRFKNLVLITNKISSNNAHTFFNNGYKYIIDSDGFWIDFRYNKKRNRNFTVIDCIQWINDTVSIDTSLSPIVSAFGFNKNDDMLIITLKDSTNNTFVTAMCIYKNHHNVVIFSKNISDQDMKYLLYSTI